MRFKSRIDRAERRVGKPECECASAKIAVLYANDDEQELPVNLCPKCGRPTMMIVVRHVGEEKPALCA